ncbi:MAG: hypothetical protein IJU78_08845 [Clostridia bacterium]|nr:hypothetical protein [Clostridia bacterium]
MKKPKRSTVILYGACAVIWTIRAIMGVTYKEYDDFIFLFTMNILCAVVWIAAFIKCLIEYRSKADENDR